MVQVIAGYRYKPQSDVILKIDKKTFKLFTIEDRAYAESEEDDVQIIAAMKRGSKMTIVGTSSRVLSPQIHIRSLVLQRLKALLIRPANDYPERT